jgi:hypothetical protein
MLKQPLICCFNPILTRARKARTNHLYSILEKSRKSKRTVLRIWLLKGREKRTVLQITSNTARSAGAAAGSHKADRRGGRRRRSARIRDDVCWCSSQRSRRRLAEVRPRLRFVELPIAIASQCPSSNRSPDILCGWALHTSTSGRNGMCLRRSDSPMI